MKRILLIALGLLSMQFAFAQFGQRTPTPNDTLKSVRVNPDGSVTFSIYAPNANSVSLTGDVWGPGPFQKAENGVWSATIPQMNAGAVRYAFNVDGLQVFDPKFSRLGEIRPRESGKPESCHRLPWRPEPDHLLYASAAHPSHRHDMASVLRP